MRSQIEADFLEMMNDPGERRRLRMLVDLSEELADRLLDYTEDFSNARQDRSLDNVVRLASSDALRRRYGEVAASPAALALWKRLSAEPLALIEAAIDVLNRGDRLAGESTLLLLVLDALNPFNISLEGRVRIAEVGLSSPHANVRGYAAEFLAAHNPDSLIKRLNTLVVDENQSVRGFAWQAGYETDKHAAFKLATGILGDDDRSIAIRRSALIAAGEHLATSDVTELLMFYVVHANSDLAVDAAELMFRHHRSPEIARAATMSPHKNVREIADYLMDPYRGSPAAGGSRPGDPTAGDIIAEMIRQLDSNVSHLEPDDSIE